MGLLDVLNGMQHGPRGERGPVQSASGGMSPITMAILGLVAYKAVKHLADSRQASPPPGGAPAAPSATGGLGGVLGGLLGGAAAGSVLSGGLGDLVRQLQQGGLGDAVNSWVGTGANQAITPADLGKALGPDQVNMLAAQTGMSSNELLSALAQHLPGVIDHLTPDGRLPSQHEVAKML